MNLLPPQHQDEARKMTETPEKIWAYTQDKTRCGIWRSDDDKAVAVEYVRADIADTLRKALAKCLNYIENTESELGITLGCGDAARAAVQAHGEPDAAEGEA
jgi:hypothetical protein